jgi:DNA replication protein DnaC
MDNPQPLPIPSPETSAMHCEFHGEYAAVALTMPTAGFKPVWSRCPGCRAEEAQALADRKALQTEADQRSHAEQAGKRFEAAGLPLRFHECTFDSFQADTPEQQKALDTCKTFADRFQAVKSRGGSLTLTGGCGTGKTHLAGALVRYLTRWGFTALYREAGQAVRYLKATYSPGCPYTEDQALATFRTPDLLVLDEVGNQHDTPDEKRVLFSILNTRYANLRPTLICSNLTGPELRTWAGDAFHDRLLEVGAIIGMRWESQRPKVRRTPK